MEFFRLLMEHLTWNEHEFLSGIRDSRKAWSLWGTMRGVAGVRKSIHQSWLTKGLGLGLLCWASRQFLTVPLVQTLLPVTFGYFLSSEAVVMGQLRRRKRLWRRSLTRLHKRTSIGPSRSFWNGTRALQLEEITSKGTKVSGVYYQCVLSIKVPKRKSLETYLMILIYIYIRKYLALNNPQGLISH